MKKTFVATLVSLFAVVGAHAAGTDGAVTTSTDPARAAAVEHHAQELQARSAHSAHSAHAAVKPVVHTTKKASKHHKHHATHKKAAAKK
jgi:hypothetical protein